MQINPIYNKIEQEMFLMRDESQASQLMRFFKCKEGEYGEGDKFLGIRVNQTRTIVRKYRNSVLLQDILKLLDSPWHELRLAGFLFMIEEYKHLKKKSEIETKKIVECYIESLERSNNWDLVDLSAPYILGDWLVGHPAERRILAELSEMDGKLWHQRVAIVANWMLIRNGVYADTFAIAQKYIKHPHDLIHKATGWMLREIGKRGGMDELCIFLDQNAHSMPRTMLRYAIEKFLDEKRLHYLRLK